MDPHYRNEERKYLNLIEKALKRECETERICAMNSYLAKNIGLLTIGQFGTKFLNFLLVPLYTNVLTTTEYGIYELLHSTATILIPILTINIYEAVLRFSLEKNEDKASVLRVGIRYVCYGTVITAGILFINHAAGFSKTLDEYSVYFFMMFFTQATAGVMSSFARGMDKVADYSISGVIATAVIIISNVVFLLCFQWGIAGYLLANILGPFVQIAFIAIRLKIWKLVKLRREDAQLAREMRKYSTPTIANGIAWWINNLSDRYIVTWLCGMATNGIYSVASKIPAILNVFQSIFNQAWMLSSVKEFDEEDESGFFSKAYSGYNGLLVLVCTGIVFFDRILSHFLFAKEFFDAWEYVPFLTISIIFGAISGYAGGIFAAIKRSDIFVKCSGAGAIANVIMNLILVHAIGAIGAAISTMISYYITYAVSIHYLRKYMRIELDLVRDNVAYVLLVLQSVFLIVTKDKLMVCYAAQVFFVAVQCVLYRRHVRYVICNCIERMRGRTK